MKMKKTIVWATCFRSRLVSSSGRISSMAAPVVPIKLASTAPTARKAVLVRGMGRQVAGDADAAADRVQAEQQHDEGDIFAENGPQEHVSGQGEVRPAEHRQHQVRRRPLGLQGKLRARTDNRQASVPPGRQTHRTGACCSPTTRPLPQQRKHGDGQQEQRKGQQRPVGRVLDMMRLGGNRLGTVPIFAPPAASPGTPALWPPALACPPCSATYGKNSLHIGEDQPLRQQCMRSVPGQWHRADSGPR